MKKLILLLLFLPIFLSCERYCGIFDCVDKCYRIEVLELQHYNRYGELVPYMERIARITTDRYVETDTHRAFWSKDGIIRFVKYSGYNDDWYAEGVIIESGEDLILVREIGYSEKYYTHTLANKGKYSVSTNDGSLIYPKTDYRIAECKD